MMKIKTQKYRPHRPSAVEIQLFKEHYLFFVWTRRGKFHRIPKVKYSSLGGLL